MEPTPAFEQYIPQSSRKRLFIGGSSSGPFVDPDVMEIPSSAFQPVRKNKQKQAITPEVIDVEDYVDTGDLMIIDEKANLSNKGKEVKHTHGSSNIQPKEFKKNSGSGLQNFTVFDSYDDSFVDYHDKYLDDFSNLQTYFDNVDIPTGVEAPVPWFQDPVPCSNKKDSGSTSSSKSSSTFLNPVGASPPFVSVMAPFVGGSSMLNPMNGLGQIAAGLDVPSSFVPPMPAQMNPSVPWWPLQPLGQVHNPTFFDYKTFYPFHAVHIPAEKMEDIPLAEDCNNVTENEDDILMKYRLFKQFDTVEDYSDHHYASKGSSTKQRPKAWAKRIQEEWKSLEKDLPDTIFVRVYESRMDLLRAVIVGAEGTPYHDGLYFFDICFPSGYPNVPPMVYYHAGGLRINPNLYACGKVCLSLLNTWSGNKNEKWIPSVSTTLQVLVSIQALILNQKPYFNEPGYESWNGTKDGESRSQEYNENTFILSLRTMVYTLRRPPKHFKDLVLGHFYKCARDILTACKAYMEGAQVGCLVKGGVQDVDEGDKSSSDRFKNSLPGYVETLMKEFKRIGVKDCENIVSLAKKGNAAKQDSQKIPSQPRRKRIGTLILSKGGKT